MDTSKRNLTVLDQISSSDMVRRKIIDAASSLYARKGFTATSIEEIAEEAGVSLPVTYHYIKSKSEVMRMIMEDMLNIFRESLLNQIKGFEDPVEKLAIAVILYFRVVDQQKEKSLLMYQKSSSLDKPSKVRVMQLEVDVSKIFGEIIQEGIDQGAFKKVDVDLMAYNIIMMAHMWVLKGWHFRRRLTLDQYIDMQLALIIDSLRRE